MALHRLANLVQSALLLAVMALVSWVTLTEIVGHQAALLLTLGMIAPLVLAPGLPQNLILSAYRARRVTARDEPALIAGLGVLARRAGLPRVPRLYHVPSALPNAFAMGDPEDSIVSVTDGLLGLLDGRELAGVLAHEVGHIANRDLWVMSLAEILSRLVSMASWLGQFLLVLDLPLVAAGALHIPSHVVVLLIFAPTLMGLVQLALSRTREYDADRAAAELTGDPEGLIRALAKLERHTGRFWEEIFLPGRRIREPSLLRTHPPTESRISRLRELGPRTSVPRPQVGDLYVDNCGSDHASPVFRRFGFYRGSVAQIA